MAQAGFILQGAQGKLANIVARKKVGGGTVLAEYKRTITNPNTVAQQSVRSKFKLLSQLGSQLKHIIAIPREGALSTRNLFAKINSDFVLSGESGAHIDLSMVQLTKSNVRPGNFTLTRDEGGSAELTTDFKPNFDHVVIVVCEIIGDFITPIFSDTADVTGPLDLQLDAAQMDDGGRYTVYMYGIKDKTEAAATKYQNMAISSADEIAQCIIKRTFDTSAYAITATAGVYTDDLSEVTSTNG